MDINILDNESTLLLKLSKDRDLYYGYITIVDIKDLKEVPTYYEWNNYKYITLEDLIVNRYKSKLDVDSYEHIKEIFKLVTTDEIYYAYYLIVKDVNKINDLYKLVNESTTNMYNEDSINAIRKVIKKKKEKNEDKLNKVIIAQKELIDIKVNYKVTKNNILSIDKTFDLIVDDKYKGLDIFNEIMCNENVVFVKYNHEGNNFYKCFSEFSRDNIIGEKLYIGNETIYLNIKHPILKTYVRVDINMNFMKVTVYNLKNQKEFNTILDVLEKSIDIINFRDVKTSDKSIECEFRMYGVNIDKNIFSYAMLNYDIFSLYLYTEESTNHVSIKKRFDINLKSDMNYFVNKDEISYSVFCIVTNGILEVEVDEKLDNGDKKSIKKGTKYINFKITRCSSIDKANEYINIITRLITYYMTKDDSGRTIEDEIIRQINVEILPEYEKIKLEDKSSNKIINRRDRHVIKDNKKITEGDNLIFKGYSTICQSDTVGDEKINRQPEAINNKEDADKWKKQGYSVMTYPNPDSLFEDDDVKPYYWVCKNEVKKYPGLMVVKPSLRNNARLPYAQCCFKNDMLKTWKDEYKENKNTKNKYAKYMMGILPEDKKANVNMKTIKMLGDEVSGNLPNILSNLFKNVKDKSIRRLGVPRSVNSVLHCLYIATDNDRYSRTSNKELFLLKERLQMSVEINPNFLKEEFYDYTPDYISKFITSIRFFDPVYVIKLLELWFKANIFMFTNKSNYEYEMLLPRYKNFYIRKYNESYPTYLIYYNKGFKSEDLKFPQCELIYYEKKGNRHYDFGGDMLKLCENMVNSLQNYKIINNNFTIYENFFKDFDINRRPKEQIIDSYGKTRGIVFDDITLIIPPTSNLNLPITDSPKLAKVNHVIDRIGKPSSVTYEKELVTGLWYSYNSISKFVYVPVIPEKTVIENTNYIYDNPISLSSSTSVIDRIYLIKRNLKLLTEIMKWLLSIHVVEGKSFQDFVDKYIFYLRDDEVIDTYEYYYLDGIYRFFPEVNGVTEAINYLTQFNYTLFNNGRVILHDEDFYNKIVYFCRPHYYTIKSKPERRIKRMIDNFYYFNRDFKYYDNTIVLINKSEFNYFLYNQDNNFTSRYTIYKTIDNTFYDKYDPFIFRNYDGNVYLVQNVMEGDLFKALTNCYNWKNNKYNSGFNPEIIEDASNVSFNSYFITSEGKLKKLLDGTEEFDVLCYGTVEGMGNGKTRYASILALKN